MIDPKIEEAGVPSLRHAQRALYANRHRYIDKVGVFHQGRTIGLLHPRTETLVDALRRLGLPGRILVEGGISEEGRISADLAALGYIVSQAGLHVYSSAGKDIDEACRWRGSQWRIVDAETDPADLARVQELQAQCAIAEMPGWFLRGLDIAARTVFLDVDGAIAACGSIQVTTRADGRGSALLAGLCVAPAYRRQRLGRTLCFRLMTVAENLWLPSEYFEVVEPENAASIALGESFGLRRNLERSFTFATCPHH